MEVIHNISNYRPQKASILTIGTFDGIHIGHQKIIKKFGGNRSKGKFTFPYFNFFSTSQNGFTKRQST